MSLSRFHLTAIAGWFVAVTILVGVQLASGVAITVAQSLAWLSLACIPSLVLVFIFRGAPPPTVGQLLYETEQAPDTARRAVARIDASRR